MALPQMLAYRGHLILKSGAGSDIRDGFKKVSCGLKSNSDSSISIRAIFTAWIDSIEAAHHRALALDRPDVLSRHVRLRAHL
ncbi:MULTISPECIES: hypothetical protein [unclassified Burkholderia]|uniref:hypothetical protein n=1 Tax=unclassified Burkholderia TaxID=2613784 RepID=UPI0014232C48|nr:MULTISPECIES: hypothetical protein [unclassified Burkholderia]NIF63933.1 hypothetical protein [Burkholderia sp. Cy-647]